MEAVRNGNSRTELLEELDICLGWGRYLKNNGTPSSMAFDLHEQMRVRLSESSFRVGSTSLVPAVIVPLYNYPLKI